MARLDPKLPVSPHGHLVSPFQTQDSGQGGVRFESNPTLTLQEVVEGGGGEGGHLCRDYPCLM